MSLVVSSFRWDYKPLQPIKPPGGIKEGKAFCSRKSYLVANWSTSIRPKILGSLGSYTLITDPSENVPSGILLPTGVQASLLDL